MPPITAIDVLLTGLISGICTKYWGWSGLFGYLMGLIMYHVFLREIFFG